MDQEIKKYEVNGQMVWTGKLFKKEGHIHDKGIHFRIRPLCKEDAEAMSEFSQTIYRNLRDGEECFIHKHDKEYYHQIFSDKNIHYIGVFVGENLIGMSSLTVCENNEQLQEELPNSNYDFFSSGSRKIASFGADSVLPEFRGNGLNAVMINYRLELAQKLGCTDCTSIVDRNNLWNMSPYFTCRFNLFATATDPADGGKISLLHKPVEKNSVLSCFKHRIAIPYNRFEIIDKLIKKGFIGVEFNRQDTNIIFAFSAYYRRPHSRWKLPFAPCSSKINTMN